MDCQVNIVATKIIAPYNHAAPPCNRIWGRKSGSERAKMSPYYNERSPIIGQLYCKNAKVEFMLRNWNLRMFIDHKMFNKKIRLFLSPSIVFLSSAILERIWLFGERPGVNHTNITIWWYKAVLSFLDA